MKKIIFGALFLGLTLFMFSCNKENISKQIEFSESEMLWITPNGKVIPAKERHNWEEYVAKNFTDNLKESSERPKPQFRSQECTTDNIVCGLECFPVRKHGDCDDEYVCTPCMNCGCTPIRSPY